MKNDQANRAAEARPHDVALSDDLVWSAAAIALEIGRTTRQAVHLLENGRLPARKIGGRWCASRAALRGFFASLLTGEVA